MVIGRNQAVVVDHKARPNSAFATGGNINNSNLQDAGFVIGEQRAGAIALAETWGRSAE